MNRSGNDAIHPNFADQITPRISSAEKANSLAVDGRDFYTGCSGVAIVSKGVALGR